MSEQLIKKYNVPAPRYTSYPTVPYWQDEVPGQMEWMRKVQHSFAENPEISLYIHLPYCEKLCTYCGCNKRITINHQVESPYIESLLKEWAMYLDQFSGVPIVKELHFGGGTPTFFSPENLAYLVNGILSKATVSSDSEFSFEAHPASTTYAHLKTLKTLGFSRISIGVQDFDEQILQTINREQTIDQVENVTRWARDLGYTSINFDLIFGLPFQTSEHIKTNFKHIRHLRPDRIAFYSYAHVPWVSPSQRAYDESDLPTGAEKRALYESGCQLLEETGYTEIGLDHFALPHDALYQAKKNRTLHRNFMGYTPHYTQLSIGLGASAISDSWDGYVQNEKKIEAYQKRVNAGEFPFFRGHFLTEEDEVIRQHILNLMCRFETDWMEEELRCDALYDSFDRLDELEKDGLLKRRPFQLRVSSKGQAFVRNICLALDAHYWKRQPKKAIFSQSV